MFLPAKKKRKKRSSIFLNSTMNELPERTMFSKHYRAETISYHLVSCTVPRISIQQCTLAFTFPISEMHRSDPPSEVAREECILVSASARPPWGEAWSSPARPQCCSTSIWACWCWCSCCSAAEPCSHRGCPGARLLRPRDRSISGSAGGHLGGSGSGYIARSHRQ